MSLRPPAPPFDELGFYFADRDDHQALRSVVEALVEQGGSFHGTAHVHAGPDASAPFGGPTDFEQVPVRVASPGDLDRLRDEGRRVVSVDMAGLPPTGDGTYAIVTFGRVPDADAAGRHPVQVWVSGDEINLFSNDPSYRAGRAAALEVARLFEALVGRLDPSYAAITCEWPLATPERFAAELATRGDHPDFFLSTAFAGDAGVRAVHEAVGEAARAVPNGVLVWTSVEFGATGAVEPGRAAAELRRRVLAAAAARRWT